MPAPRRRSCPATARSPICSGRMTHPAPLRPSPVPSISRLFATPFARVVGALQRVAAGRYEERLDEDQPEEFGTIAHGVNQMAAALSWRERMQDQAGRLLSALNAPPREASAGGSFGPALDVIAGATGAPALALYQPQYDTNE